MGMRFVVEGYFGSDYENPTNPLTILFMTMPLLFLIVFLGLLINVFKYVFIRWIFKNNVDG